ncbi:MAG: hypothetical protein M1840_005101 [Geoglossum simile]|nr:MAG: hypothetical protein M1840_005101 [Geoglossum simile]
MARSLLSSLLHTIICLYLVGLTIIPPVLGMIVLLGAGSLQGNLNATPELLRAPYSRFLRPSQIVAYSLGLMECMLGSTTFIILPLIASRYPKQFLFLLGLWDVIQSGGFSTVVVLQAKFLPAPLGSCQNADQWAFSGVKPSVFQVLAGSAMGKRAGRTAVEQCGRFLYIRRLEIAIIVLSLMRLAGVLLAASPFLYRKVSKRAVPPVRFAYRYFEKWKQYQGHLASAAEKPSTGFSLGAGLELEKILRPCGKERVLAEALSQYPITSSLARNVHYVDMRNLMLVSKAIRNAVLMSGTGMLKRNTCAGGTKMSCWGCGNQICKVSAISQSQVLRYDVRGKF